MQLTHFFYNQAFFCSVFFFMFIRVRRAIGVIGFFLLLVLAAIVNVGGQTSLSSTGDGGVEQVNLGDQSHPSNVQDRNNSSSVSFFDATG